VLIVFLSASMTGFFDAIIEHQFDKVDLADMHVDFYTELPRACLHEIADTEGVRSVEPLLQFGAELRNGQRTKTVLVLGLPAQSRLYRVFDADGQCLALPDDGLLVPDRVADALNLCLGSSVQMDPYLKDRDEVMTTVRGMSEEYLGLNVYARLDYLARLMGVAGTINGALVAAEPNQLRAAAARLDDAPAVTAVTATRAMLEGFKETVADLTRATTFTLTLFAAVIAFAVIYNSSSVNIAEQERDLACLCSMGYERDDVARIATNDIMPLGIVGILVGLPLGYLMCLGLSKLYTTDIYKLPAVVYAKTYFAVTVQVLIFQLAARWVCARRAHRIDIVRRLKSRE
jgi:putative ABC transport system permease protein